VRAVAVASILEWQILTESCCLGKCWTQNQRQDFAVVPLRLCSKLPNLAVAASVVIVAAAVVAAPVAAAVAVVVVCFAGLEQIVQWSGDDDPKRPQGLNVGVSELEEIEDFWRPAKVHHSLFGRLRKHHSKMKQ